MDKKSVSTLSRASNAIAELEDSIQMELWKQTMIPNDNTKNLSQLIDSAPSANTMETDHAKSIDLKYPESLDCSADSNAHGQLEVSDDETVEQLCLAAYFLSPASSGLYDEILALVEMGVIFVSNSGIPILDGDWPWKVDFVILEDMDTAWGSQGDPEGRYCVNQECRDAVEEDWVKTNCHWVLASDPEAVIFDTGVLEEWRKFVQGQAGRQGKLSRLDDFYKKKEWHITDNNFFLLLLPPILCTLQNHFFSRR